MKQSNKKSFFILLQTFLLELQLYFIVTFYFIDCYDFSSLDMTAVAAVEKYWRDTQKLYDIIIIIYKIILFLFDLKSKFFKTCKCLGKFNHCRTPIPDLPIPRYYLLTKYLCEILLIIAVLLFIKLLYSVLMFSCFIY